MVGEKKVKFFEVSGEFIEGKEKKRFSKKVEAVNESFAAEKVLSIFGSKHRTPRRKIFLNEVKELKEA